MSITTAGPCAPLTHSTLPALVAVLVLGFAPASHAQGAQGAPAAPAVIVAEAQTEQVSDRLEALGTAYAAESVTITSVVAEKIVTLSFDDGDHVSAGQVLAVLDNRVDEASLSRARATLADRRNVLERAETLARQKLASTEDRDRARWAVSEAEAEVGGLEARVDRHVIRAPFDGTVGMRSVSLGALVSPGDVITTLDDTSRIKLDFPVPAVHLPDLAPGLTVTAHAGGGGQSAFTGVVDTIGTRVDPATRAVLVRALLDNPDNLIRPGMLMRVALERNPRSSVTIPEAALVPRGRVQRVFVVGADGMAQSRPVEIGTRTRGTVEILSGLEPGERVVTDGIDKVRDGQPVLVRAVDDGTRSLADLLSSVTPP